MTNAVSNQQLSSDFRPNPDRGVFLSGDIEQATLDSLTPEILRYQNKSKDPITLYLDSFGGDTSSAQTLHDLLTSRDQDGNPGCRIITVATGVAASAAADLLMYGDYALAYPHAVILCHGVRNRAETLTHEKAMMLAKDLAVSNERYAIQLANNCIKRFIFRVAVMSSEFPAIRERFGNPNLPYSECFIEYVSNKVSASLVTVLKEALKRSNDSDDLDNFTKERLNIAADQPVVRFEIAALNAILEYEAERHKADSEWSLRAHGLERVQDKFDLLFNKYDRYHVDAIEILCARWADMFLSSEQRDASEKLSENDAFKFKNDAVKEIMQSLWFFFVSICRDLQKGDHWMKAEEAYWLGLIDEVVGRTDLPSMRLFVEFPPPEVS